METSKIPWTTYLWPGVTQLCHHGAWPALAVAVLFGLLLNTALISTFVWSELLAPGTRSLTWLAVAVSWVGFALFSHHWYQRQHAPVETGSTDERFLAAQNHYLQRNWFEAQRSLTGLIRRNPRDLDARLMLATLLRHAGRIDEAAQQLNWLQRLEGAEKWEPEIRCEWERLQEARSAEGLVPTPTSPSEASEEQETAAVKDAA